jgi:hypothetical protein
MRLFFLSGALVALMGPLAPAQSVSDIISSEQRFHDFGAVAKASTAEHRFQLRNPFNAEMFVQGVRTTCGCTTPTVEKQVIAPGETGTVLAHFNTDRFNGEKKATLTVTITKPIFTEIQLNVRGYIRTDVVLNPGEAAFGSVPEGTSRRLKLDLNYAGRSDWEIKNVVAPFPFIQTRFNEISRGGGRVQYEIDVELTDAAPEGFLSNQLVIHTNDNRLKTVPIQLTADIERLLQTSPASIALGTVKPNEAIAQRMTMKCKSNFIIHDITCNVGSILFEPPAKESKVHVLRVMITPQPPEDFIDGELKGKLFIHTDLADEPFEIPVSCTIESEKLADAQ